MNLEQQPMLSMKNSQQINIPLVNPKNFKSTSGLDQQARLDELISHVKAAAAVVAGYHTSTNTTATAALIVSTLVKTIIFIEWHLHLSWRGTHLPVACLHHFHREGLHFERFSEEEAVDVEENRELVHLESVSQLDSFDE
jgi:hypothetical protein